MSKRRLASSPSRLKPKKPKKSAGQPTLDKFFRSSLSVRLSDAVAGSSKTGERDTKVGDQGIWLEAPSEMPEMREVIDVDLSPEDSSPTLRPATGLGPDLVRSPKAGSSTEDPRDPVTNAKPTPFVTKSVKPAYQSLSVDPIVFNLDSEPWPCNNPAPYSFLSHTLATLSETRSRILIINTLTNALRTISRHHPSSLLPALYLLSNSLGPPYLSIELGLGPSIISKAIQQVSGLTSAALKRLYNTTGDVGDVAFEAKSNLRTLIPHPPLLIITVFDSLQKIARCNKGQGVAKQKQSIVEKLLIAAKGEEVRFLTRTLSMNLRVGAVRTSILTALARAMVLTPPGTLIVPIPSDSPYNATPELLSEVEDYLVSPKKNNNSQARREITEKFGLAESLVKQVFVQHPNYDHIVAALLDAGLDGLAERVPLAVGTS
jgi:DNA ligase 1